jgi:hypothetical protein
MKNGKWDDPLGTRQSLKNVKVDIADFKTIAYSHDG